MTDPIPEPAQRTSRLWVDYEINFYDRLTGKHLGGTVYPTAAHNAEREIKEYVRYWIYQNCHGRSTRWTFKKRGLNKNNL